MKTYFINRVNGFDAAITVTSINDLEQKAIAFCDKNIGECKIICVHCSHVYSTTNVDEQNVRYLIRINNASNARQTITTRRI